MAQLARNYHKKLQKDGL
jgi:hypothetical protein